MWQGEVPTERSYQKNILVKYQSSSSSTHYSNVFKRQKFSKSRSNSQDQGHKVKIVGTLGKVLPLGILK